MIAPGERGAVYELPWLSLLSCGCVLGLVVFVRGLAARLSLLGLLERRPAGEDELLLVDGEALVDADLDPASVAKSSALAELVFVRDEALEILRLQDVEQLAEVFHAELMLFVWAVVLLDKARKERRVDEAGEELAVLLVVLVYVRVEVEELVRCFLFAWRCGAEEW